MDQVECVEAIRFVRKLRGGSQPVLVEASDGFHYVVKFQNNFQGPNLLFNEAIGTEIFRLAGLPVPSWRIVTVSESFLARHPDCWLETEHGLVKPRAGQCFGSRSLEWNEFRVFEILAGGYFGRVHSRRDFWTAWVLDVLCEHTDNRQALFVEGSSRWLDAWFVDHGHLMGGANGTQTPFYRASRYIDPRIYPETASVDAEEIAHIVRGIDLLDLAQTALQLPMVWKTATSVLRFGRLMQRIGDPALVASTTSFVLGMTASIRTEAHRQNYERKPAHSRLRCEGEGVRAQISAIGSEAGGAGRNPDPVRSAEPRGPKALSALWLRAASF
jgi:hypothetical protein